MIKVTTSEAYGMFDNLISGNNPNPIIDITNFKGLSNKFEPNTSASIYLHGDLEDKAGFDIPIFLEGEIKYEGIHDAIALLPGDDNTVQEIKAKIITWKSKLYKPDIKILGYGLDFVKVLKPVSFRRDERTNYNEDKTGFSLWQLYNIPGHLWL